MKIVNSFVNKHGKKINIVRIKKKKKRDANLKARDIQQEILKF